MPSRATSVYSTSETPAAFTRRATSAALSPVPSSQPATATSPPLASMPQTIRPGKRAHASRTRSRRCTAAVPRTAKAAPSRSTSSTASIVRSPPPTSMGTPTAAMARIAAPFTGRPARAPSRSTTWIRSAPAARKPRAISAGSDE
jgi:hypothetical protein